MVKKRVVTRTYKTRKGIVTKTYEYDYSKKSRKKVLVDSAGRIRKKALAEAQSNLTPGDLQDLMEIIQTAQTSKERLTVNKALANVGDKSIKRMIHATGYNTSELAAELGISEFDLLDSENWDGSKLTVDDKSWNFTFRYEGDVLVEA